MRPGMLTRCLTRGPGGLGLLPVPHCSWLKGLRSGLGLRPLTAAASPAHARSAIHTGLSHVCRSALQAAIPRRHPIRAASAAPVPRKLGRKEHRGGVEQEALLLRDDLAQDRRPAPLPLQLGRQLCGRLPAGSAISGEPKRMSVLAPNTPQTPGACQHPRLCPPTHLYWHPLPLSTCPHALSPKRLLQPRFQPPQPPQHAVQLSLLPRRELLQSPHPLPVTPRFHHLYAPAQLPALHVRHPRLSLARRTTRQRLAHSVTGSS